MQTARSSVRLWKQSLASRLLLPMAQIRWWIRPNICWG
jgi:hypothetical protein